MYEYHTLSIIAASMKKDGNIKPVWYNKRKESERRRLYRR